MDYDEFQLALRAVQDMSPEDYEGLVSAWQQETGNVGEYEKEPVLNDLALFLLKEAKGEPEAAPMEEKGPIQYPEYQSSYGRKRTVGDVLRTVIGSQTAGPRMQSEINRLFGE